MTELQQAIRAQLPRVNEGGEGDYVTAEGLLTAPDAHPLVERASLQSLRASLGHLTRQGLIVSHCWNSNGTGLRLYAVRRWTPSVAERGRTDPPTDDR